MGRAVRAPVEATLEIQSWQEKPQKGCPCIDFKKEKAYNVPFDMLAAWLRNQTGKLFPKFV
jgi:hypothetical protein